MAKGIAAILRGLRRPDHSENPYGLSGARLSSCSQLKDRPSKDLTRSSQDVSNDNDQDVSARASTPNLSPKSKSRLIPLFQRPNLPSTPAFDFNIQSERSCPTYMPPHNPQYRGRNQSLPNPEPVVGRLFEASASEPRRVDTPMSSFSVEQCSEDTTITLSHKSSLRKSSRSTTAPEVVTPEPGPMHNNIERSDSRNDSFEADLLREKTRGEVPSKHANELKQSPPSAERLDRSVTAINFSHARPANRSASDGVVQSSKEPARTPTRPRGNTVTTANQSTSTNSSFEQDTTPHRTSVISQRRLSRRRQFASGSSPAPLLLSKVNPYASLPPTLPPPYPPPLNPLQRIEMRVQDLEEQLRVLNAKLTTLIGMTGTM